MMAEPGSDTSGNVMPRESANFFSVSGGSYVIDTRPSPCFLMSS